LDVFFKFFVFKHLISKLQNLMAALWQTNHNWRLMVISAQVGISSKTDEPENYNHQSLIKYLTTILIIRSETYSLKSRYHLWFILKPGQLI